MDCPRCEEEFGVKTPCWIASDGWEEYTCSYHDWIRSFKWDLPKDLRERAMGRTFAEYLEYHLRYQQYTLPPPAYIFAQTLVDSLPDGVVLGDRKTIDRHRDQIERRVVWIYTHRARVVERRI